MSKKSRSFKVLIVLILVLLFSYGLVAKSWVARLGRYGSAHCSYYMLSPGKIYTLVVKGPPGLTGYVKNLRTGEYAYCRTGESEYNKYRFKVNYYEKYRLYMRNGDYSGKCKVTLYVE